MQKKSGVTLINVFTPKSGKAAEFARTQIRDYEKLGKTLDGALRNHFYISVNESDKPKLINVAEFESLEIFYRTTGSETFKKHIEEIRPLLDDGEPMLCQLLWQSEDPSLNDVEHALSQLYPERVVENRKLADELGFRRLPKSA